MEKFIFLATIKSKLTEMNLPKETVEKHVKIFEDCFKGKGASDIDKVIDSAGGMDGILLSIYNLENAKQKDNKYVCPTAVKNNITNVSETNNESVVAQVESSTESEIESQVNENAPEGTEPQETDEKSPLPSESQISAENAAEEVTNNNPEVDLNGIFGAETQKPNEPTDADIDSPTIEIPKTSEIVEHIKEAEKITQTLERIPIPQTAVSEEFSSELSDYDFEKLFEEKISKPEGLVKKLREKMSDKVFKLTLPIAFIAIALLFLIVSALFPLLLVTAVFCAVGYVATLILGLCFAVIPLGYGIYMCFKSMPVALYELGIASISTGATMLASILLYNYVKRLVPFLFKQLIKLFKLAIKVTKRYFKKPIKEAE